jgi:hypothetical protein
MKDERIVGVTYVNPVFLHTGSIKTHTRVGNHREIMSDFLIGI